MKGTSLHKTCFIEHVDEIKIIMHNSFKQNSNCGYHHERGRQQVIDRLGKLYIYTVGNTHTHKSLANMYKLRKLKPP